MEKLIKSLEKLGNTNIYFKIYGIFEYGKPSGAIVKINSKMEMTVEQCSNCEEIAAILEEHGNLYLSNIDMVEEMYVCHDNSFAVMEVAKLTLAQGEVKEIYDIFLKMVSIHSGAEALWIINEYGEAAYSYIRNDETIDYSSIKSVCTKVNNKGEYCSADIGEKTAAAYKYGDDEKIVVLYSNNDEMDHKEILLKMMTEEFSVVMENRLYRETLENLYFKLIKRVADIINKRNFAHGNDYVLDTFIRVATIIGKNYGLSADELRKLRIVSVLKDTGSILIPENILHKVEALTQHEYNIQKKHPLYSANILEQTEYFEDIINEIKYHHEKWGGGGYPAELAGKEIPIVSRIIHLVDVFMALINKRVYRPKYFTEDEALEVIVSDNADHFDPELIEIFVNSFDDIKKAVKNNS